jgi:hypothetical protein
MQEFSKNPVRYPREIYSLPRFIEAIAHVKNRAISVKDNKPHLIPLMYAGLFGHPCIDQHLLRDVMEHDTRASNEPSWTAAGVFAKPIVRVTADVSYSIGEEVFISYGAKSSAECLEVCYYSRIHTRVCGINQILE